MSVIDSKGSAIPAIKAGIANLFMVLRLIFVFIYMSANVTRFALRIAVKIPQRGITEYLKQKGLLINLHLPKVHNDSQKKMLSLTLIKNYVVGCNLSFGIDKPVHIWFELLFQQTPHQKIPTEIHFAEVRNFKCGKPQRKSNG